MKRRALLAPLLGVPWALSLSACAGWRPPAPSPKGALWRGRLSLVVVEEPPQHLLATFELSGNPQQGQLSLSGPLGTPLAQVEWGHEGATLLRGDSRQQANSLTELLNVVGMPSLPLLALFDWLDGRDTAYPGWEVDLSQHDQGRLNAVRTHPKPQARLRLLLEP